MTPQQGADWMLKELQSKGWLDQEAAAYALHRQDKALTYTNDSGNLAISKDVLKIFNKIAPTASYVWSRSDRQWRKRAPRDAPGRAQY
ncbi:hypothetical protein KV697_06040 [Sphingomonas sanguinis]|uniref:DUF6953 family protein n=1 Tax=Sphingomonas sanguinis TaxID=33051 RepID=UPI001C57921C|nr:hypothetical protein [Sphingomonas sanguinis]QXT36859.1 hypothetical protein KV697_06040 [Sphingomonas sanguinis]